MPFLKSERKKKGKVPSVYQAGRALKGGKLRMSHQGQDFPMLFKKEKKGRKPSFGFAQGCWDERGPLTWMESWPDRTR